MAQQIRTILKTYFETGDVPTEAQFIDLIDSLFNIAESDVSNILSLTQTEYDALETKDSTILYVIVEPTTTTTTTTTVI